jgi:hypothetical protein
MRWCGAGRSEAKRDGDEDDEMMGWDDDANEMPMANRL